MILGVSEGAGKYMAGFKIVAAMVRAMVESLGITVPVALHLDHGTYEGAKACIEAGFTSIMFDGSHYPIDENVAKTTELVAHGRMTTACPSRLRWAPSAARRTASSAPARWPTRPSARKITALGIDFLAAGIGNIHGKYPANWKGLDFEALDKIHQATGTSPGAARRHRHPGRHDPQGHHAWV